MAQVTFTPKAHKQLAKTPRTIKVRMFAIVDRLSDWPKVSGAKPLSGNLSGHYRIRTGNYRLQFRVEENNVIVEKIGHRDGFYED